MFLLLGLACATAPEEPPKDRVTIGIHDVALRVPEGWLHLDHGLEHRFHRDLRQISVADIGPVTREGYLREIDHARELFRNDQVEDAQAHLRDLRLRSAFPGDRRWEAISDAYHIALDGGLKKNSTPNEIEEAYDTVIRGVEQLETPSLTVLVERLFPIIETAAHREISGLQPVEISGLKGMRVESWDRLSHDHRQSFLFVLNEHNMLVARMELGKYAEMRQPFEALVESLEFPGRPQSAAAAGS
jgi:hypothetical protein